MSQKNNISPTSPGPWYAVEYAGCFNLQWEDSYSQTNLLDKEYCENAEANALLAASAPDLLAALKQLIEEATELMDHCIDKSFIDPEDESIQGVIDFNLAINQANKVINIVNKLQKDEN